MIRSQWPLFLSLLFLLSCSGGKTGEKLNGRMFVTSQTFNGNLGGLNGADSRCQLAADGAGLGGLWKAWLSTSGVTAASRLTLTYPLVRITGEPIFETENDRLVGLPRNAPDVDEKGHSVGAVGVWTNTDTVGSTLMSNDCNAWTSSTGGLSGGIGSTQDSTAGHWTQSGTSLCSNALRLYCVEQ